MGPRGRDKTRLHQAWLRGCEVASSFLFSLFLFASILWHVLPSGGIEVCTLCW